MKSDDHEGNDPSPDGSMQSGAAMKEDAAPPLDILQADRETDTSTQHHLSKTLEVHQQTASKPTDYVEVADGKGSNLDRPQAHGTSNELGVQKPAAAVGDEKSSSPIEEALKGEVVASMKAPPNQGEGHTTTSQEESMGVSGEPASGQMSQPAATLSDEQLEEAPSGKSNQPDCNSSAANNTFKDGSDDLKPARSPEDLNVETTVADVETVDDKDKIKVKDTDTDTASTTVEVDGSKSGSPDAKSLRINDEDLQVDAFKDPPTRPEELPQNPKEDSDPAPRAGTRSTRRPASPRKRHKIELADGNGVIHETGNKKKSASDIHPLLLKAPFEVADRRRNGYGGRPRCMALTCKKAITAEGKKIGLCAEHLLIINNPAKFNPPAKFKVEDVVIVQGKAGKGNKGGLARVSRVASLVDGDRRHTYDVKFYRDGDERLAVPEKMIKLHDVDEAQLVEDVMEEQRRKGMPITGVMPQSRASKSKAKKPARDRGIPADEPDKLSPDPASENTQGDESLLDPVVPKRARRLRSRAKEEPAREQEAPVDEQGEVSPGKTEEPKSKRKQNDEAVAEQALLQFDSDVVLKKGRRLCKVKGCTKYSQTSSTGMCYRHYKLSLATKKDPEIVESSSTSEPVPKRTKQSRGPSTNSKAKKRKFEEVAVSVRTPSSKRSLRQDRKAQSKSQERKRKEEGEHLSTVSSRHSKRMHKSQPNYKEPSDDESVEIISTTPSPKRRRSGASEQQTSTGKPRDGVKYSCPFPGCKKTNLTKMGIRAHHGLVHPGVEIDWANIKRCRDVSPPVPPSKPKANSVSSPFSSTAPASGGTRRSKRTPIATNRYGVDNNSNRNEDGGDDNKEAGGGNSDGSSGDELPEGGKKAEGDGQSAVGEGKGVKSQQMAVVNWTKAVRTWSNPQAFLVRMYLIPIPITGRRDSAPAHVQQRA